MTRENTSCHFCKGGDGVTETHHIVPRRFGGSNDGENLVELCPTCHRKVESLYDRDFYQTLGVENEPNEPEQCCFEKCTAETTNQLEFAHIEETAPVCEAHSNCSKRGCGKASNLIVDYDGKDKASTMCERHARCFQNGCKSTETKRWDVNGWQGIQLCHTHWAEQATRE